MIDTQEAAKRLKKSRRWVRSLCKRGILPAKRMGRDWFISPKDLDIVRNLPRGRPKKRA